MFWGKDSLSKIAKKHHTVSSYCSCVDDMRLVGVTDDFSTSTEDLEPSSTTRKRITRTRTNSIENESFLQV